MDDYYKILGIQYDASITDITNTFNLKIFEYKALPFLTDKDKQSIKNLKKAFFVLSNEEYKKTYDISLKNSLNNAKDISGVEDGSYYLWSSSDKSTNNSDIVDTIATTNNGTKKQLFNHSYISDRIFSLTGNNNNTNFNVSNSETLRPKNVGLSSDVKIDFDTPIDYN
jgi:DnaJ-class molecular chaperone